MGKALLRFYEELNDTLPPGKRKRDFEVSLKGKESVRDVIERLGVLPEQVDLLLVNGRSVGLEEQVRNGDRISVYPVFERLNLEGASRVRDKPLRETAFIAGSNLETLAGSLKALGLDVILGGDLTAEQILRMAKEGRRILLTQQEDLAGLQGLDRRIVLKPGPLHDQVRQIFEALDLRVGPEKERGHEREEPKGISEKG
jgi:sulfur carrier protein ThiS